MPSRSLVVALLQGVCVAALGCPALNLVGAPAEVGVLQSKKLKECSGIVASRAFPGVFWVHNDGGGPKRQVLYAIDRSGRGLAEFRVLGVQIVDWEDLAIDGEQNLYLADTGNNDATRTELAVHRLREPNPRSSGGSAAVTRTWRLTFPGKPFDAESLFICQTNGYLISKVTNDRRAEIYRFPLDSATECKLQHVATLPITSPVAGADISADGRQLAVVAKSGAFMFRVDGDVARAAQLPGYNAAYRNTSIEGCCFVPDGLLATSEKGQLYLYKDAPFRPVP
jgi:hypothetical protein